MSWTCRVALAVLTLGIGACYPWRQPMTPIPTLDFSGAKAADAGPLVVFLPGLYDRPRDFLRSGVVEIVRQARPDATLVAVDAHFGYYRRKTVLDRLWEDVLAPARRRGHEEIWLVGVSLGRFGALLTAEERPEAITGVVALAPYLGPRELLREITDAGGPRRWQASDPSDTMQNLWLWLRDEPATAGSPADDAPRPRLFLGYGEGDRSAGDHAVLAGLLPAQQVATVTGGHDWKAWRQALEELLEKGALAGPP